MSQTITTQRAQLTVSDEPTGVALLIEAGGTTGWDIGPTTDDQPNRVRALNFARDAGWSPVSGRVWEDDPDVAVSRIVIERQNVVDPQPGDEDFHG